MIRVSIHGTEARFSVQDGWTSTDGLTERFLRAWCTPGSSGKISTSAAEEQAKALAAQQYPDAFAELDPDGPPEPSSRQTNPGADAVAPSPQANGQASTEVPEVHTPTL